MSYGELPEIPVGAIYPNRLTLFQSGLHRDIQRGITGRRDEYGAESIVLSHGYEDDVDLGDLIFYTGDGGRDNLSGHQIRDQTLSGRNQTMALNVETRQPVRVIRSTSGGYRYDGLYTVEDVWLSPGKSGFLVCRFRLRRHSTDRSLVRTTKVSPRKETTLFRLVRDTALSAKVKALHDFRCQICGVRVETIAGPYAEAAHILPLGEDYKGPDEIENMLCLCPNDHVRFDHGALFISDELAIIDNQGNRTGCLCTTPNHPLSIRWIRAHRNIFGKI